MSAKLFLLETGDGLDMGTHLLRLLLDVGDSYLGRHLRQTGHIDTQGLLVGDVDGAEVESHDGSVVFEETLVTGLESLGEESDGRTE